MSLYMLPIQDSADGRSYYAVLSFPDEWFPILLGHIKSLPEPSEHIIPGLHYPMSPGVSLFKRTKFTDEVLSQFFPEEDPYDGDPYDGWFMDPVDTLLPISFEKTSDIHAALKLVGETHNHHWSKDVWIYDGVCLDRHGELSGSIMITSRDDESSTQNFQFTLNLNPTTTTTNPNDQRDTNP